MKVRDIEHNTAWRNLQMHAMVLLAAWGQVDALILLIVNTI